ncbi:MAG: fumarate reductase/succinate dehydrogenase flavoprotein subunit, partial [Proteobacteria bacterium]|nr:fumarate reductase/succinate dehydrogenase flavoprotein subunit [Pseudomonadota bacterium]
IGDYLASIAGGGVSADHPEVQAAQSRVIERINKLLSIKGKRSVDSFWREFGRLMWDKCGMSRTEAGLKEALQKIPAIREEFWKNAAITGSGAEVNETLEKAGRVADLMELGELMCRDALERNESCGGHFREEYQTPDGEALRNDADYCYSAVWGYSGKPEASTSGPLSHTLYKEKLEFENIKLQQRSYK